MIILFICSTKALEHAEIKMLLLNRKVKEKSIKILPEVLLDNRLEKDTQKMMYPVHLMFSIFLSSKYTVRDDYVTPRGKVYYTFTFLFVVILYVMAVKRLFFEELGDSMGTYNNDLVTIFYLFFCFFYLTGFTILFFLNIIHSDASISLILLIQSVFVSLEFKDNLKKITRRNWVAMFGVFFLNICLHYLYYVTFNEFNVSDTLFDFMFITFDLNLVYALLVIVLLRKYLEKWIQLVIDNVDDASSAKLFVDYRNILEAYNFYKATFQLVILFHTVDTFFRCLFYFTLVLQVLTMLDNVQTDRRVVILSVSLVLSVVWLSKDVMLVMIQSMQCEKFYITIEKAETACIQRLKNKHYLDCERNLCKDVVQLNRVSFSKMSAC
ncbi:hypothetical protein HF086_018389, partial [Spodoptera exigua]